MGVKPDRWIADMASRGMIEPFERGQVGGGVISYGLSSYGYDMRLNDEFRIFESSGAGVIDPKSPPAGNFRDLRTNACTIPPGSFVLGRSLEYFRIPRDVIALCLGKSTYARSGILVNITPLEPEWEGYVTISIFNTSGMPADRKGKYQAQKGIVGSKT
jgi:dCTP deaminase